MNDVLSEFGVLALAELGGMVRHNNRCKNGGLTSLAWQTVIADAATVRDSKYQGIGVSQPENGQFKSIILGLVRIYGARDEDCFKANMFILQLAVDAFNYINCEEDAPEEYATGKQMKEEYLEHEDYSGQPEYDEADVVDRERMTLLDLISGIRASITDHGETYT